LPLSGQPPAAAADPTLGARRLTATEAGAEVDLAWRALQAIHPGLDRYTARAELQADVDSLRARCGAGLDERELFAALSLLTAKIRCSHTKVEPSEAWDAARAATPSYLPFRWLRDRDAMVVRRSAAPELSAGDRVVAIDGVATAVVLAQMFAATPADGFTDGARWFGVQSSSDFFGSELDHFYPAFFAVRSPLRLEVRKPGAASTVSVPIALLTRAQVAAAFADEAVADDLVRAVGWRALGDGVALLHVDTFIAYRSNVDPIDVLRPVFAAIRASGAKTLILDLRKNGGGSSSAGVALLRCLLREPWVGAAQELVKTIDLGDLIDRVETWDPAALKPPPELFERLPDGFYRRKSAPLRLEPLAEAFAGKLAVLCGPGNASGSTMFLAALRAAREVTLIGEPTGGAGDGPTAGTILFLRLPHSGMRVRIPAVRTVTGLAGVTTGEGVRPDLLVAPTLEDELAGRDPALQRAREWARTGR
jgi:C-terminal processing protease CtpA/Prc